MPGYVDTGLNFVAVEDAAAGHLLAAEKGRVGERYLIGAENLTLKQMLDILARITGRPAPRWKIPHSVGAAGRLCGYVVLAFARPRAADSGGRREDGAAHDVCGLLARAARAGICAWTGGRGAGACGTMVRRERLREGAPCARLSPAQAA